MQRIMLADKKEEGNNMFFGTIADLSDFTKSLTRVEAINAIKRHSGRQLVNMLSKEGINYPIRTVKSILIYEVLTRIQYKGKTKGKVIS